MTHAIANGFKASVRFDQDKAGIQANRDVLHYGLRRLPDLYQAHKPLSDQKAVDLEIGPAIRLRQAGFGVWQAWRAPCRLARR